MAPIIFPWLVPDDPASFASLQEHADLITHVSPTWYDMDADLAITSRMDDAVAAFARERRIALHPLIRNERFDPEIAHRILETPSRRAEAAERIARIVLEQGFDGINLDFEGTFGASRDRYTDLAARLVDALRPARKWVTVDVVCQLQPAASYPVETSWAAPFDYDALGEVCDAVMLMGYDYAMRTPGPVSPLWWLQEVIAYARAHIPSHKVVVGLPFYGRHWIVEGGRVSPAYGLKQAEALELLARSGAELERPERDATPRFAWRDAEGEHVVHFDDAESLARKMRLAAAPDLAGVAFWRLGQEEPGQWEVIAQAVQSLPD